MSLISAVEFEQERFKADVCGALGPYEGTGPRLTSLPEPWSGTSNRIVASPYPLRRSPEDLATIEEADMTGTTSSSFRSEWWGSEDRTGAQARDDLIPLLEQVASERSPRAFVALIRTVDWSTRSPGELSRAIDLALRHEKANLATRLAQLGRGLFPHHKQIGRAARVLSPGQAHSTHLPPAKDLSASRKWLREHADEYRGRWVALSGGKLVDVAPSLEEMEDIADRDENGGNLFVTRVL